YLAVFIWMLFAYLTHRIKWRSRYSLLFSHVAIRLASQGCGVAFGILGFSNTNLFLAYLVLGAEGYFSLVMCVFRFVISWHEHNLPSRSSWLEPRDPPGTKKFSTKALVDSMKLSYYRDHPMMCLHLALILANVAIVVGGSFLAGANFTDAEDKRAQMRLDLSKILRTAGQGVFLACNAILLGILLLTIRNNLRDGDSRRKKGSVHPTLYLLLISWFPLMVRGAFGVLQSAIFQVSIHFSLNTGGRLTYLISSRTTIVGSNSY
ncbi:hypothetical protein C8J57DRAFT_1065917, partial [Mycena rebaudengoi]